MQARRPSTLYSTLLAAARLSHLGCFFHRELRESIVSESNRYEMINRIKDV